MSVGGDQIPNGNAGRGADETAPAPEIERRDDFFVGYLGRLPAASRALIATVVVGLVVGFLGGAWAIGASQADPGPAGFGRALTLEGVIYAEPYPYLRTPPADGFPNGRTVTLGSARGKYGVQTEASEFDGRSVEVRGPTINRGDIVSIQVGWNGRAGAHRVTPIEADLAARLSPVEDLGRWRIRGEICDGKCWLGAMRPGRGLAHKACANFCVIGGSPALFVTEAPIEGEEFLLLADSEGRTPGPELLDRVAERITLEGEVERHGDLLIFKADLATGLAR